ncbi:MAG: translation elongation factor Ts [bacterium]
MQITASMVKELREISGAGMMDCKSALTETNGNMDEAMNYLREKGISKSLKKESRIAAEGLANVYIEGNNAVILEINSETDFVSKNEEFKILIDTIGKLLLENKPSDVESALEIKCDEGTIKDLIINKTAIIGEKLSFRRFVIMEKTEGETFGSYIHMGGRIAVLTKIKGENEEAAKDVSMQSAAMKPTFVFPKDVSADVLDNEKEIIKAQAIEEGKSPEIAEKMVDGRIKKFYTENCLSEQVFVKDDKLTITKFLSNNNCELIDMVRLEVGEGIEKKEENFAEEVMKQVG